MRTTSALILLLLTSSATALEVDGQTEFAQTLALNGGVDARVAEVRVVAGQRVRAGDVLVRFDATALAAEVRIAEAQVRRAQPALERVRTEFDRARELFDRDSLALVELDNARRAFTAAEAALAAAEAELDKARYRLSLAEIRAPVDGIVLGVTTFPGHFVNRGVSDPVLVTLAENLSMLARALLPVEQYDPGLLGRAARVRFHDRTFNGRVVGLEPRAMIAENNHPAVIVRVKFTTDGKLPANLPVRLEIDDN